MDGRIILGQEIVARDHGAACAGLLRERFCRLGEVGGRHVLGRCVDQVAGQKNTPRETLDLGTVGALRPDQRREALRALLVAREGIGAERPAERRLGRGRTIERAINDVASDGQRLGKARESPQLLILGNADDDPRRTAARTGQKGELPGLAGEAESVEPSPIRLGDLAEPCRETLLCHRNDRGRLGRFGRQMGEHQEASVLFAVGWASERL